MSDFGTDRIAFRGIRYRTMSGNGQLWSQPTRLYFAEAFAHTQPTAVYLYDHTRFPQNLITVLCATPEAKSEKFPPVDVTIPIERGVYVSFSQSAFVTGGVTLGFSP